MDVFILSCAAVIGLQLKYTAWLWAWCFKTRCRQTGVQARAETLL